jgi:DNA-binding NarL/FixJ family response regulator
MNSMSDIKVAIVEDNAALRDGLSVILRCSPGFQCAGAYASADEALQQIPLAPPDVVLMDINLPGTSGIECVRQLTRQLPELLVMMLTIEEDPARVFESLEAGATGYLVKSEPLSEILAAIQEVHRGGSPMSSQIARMIVQSFHRPGPKHAPEQRLTTREQEILELTAKGYRSKEVASALGISLRTVETHLRSIYDKLHVRSRVEAVTRFLQRPQARERNAGE